MNHAAKITRDDTITDALRAINDAIGNEEPTDQAFRIIAAVKRLRDDKVRVASAGVDYLERVQQAARDAWRAENAGETVGPSHAATAGVDTPIGRLICTTWRAVWTGSKRGERIAWCSEYMLDDAPISISEIKDAGLAQRPTTRNRKKK